MLTAYVNISFAFNEIYYGSTNSGWSINKGVTTIEFMESCRDEDSQPLVSGASIADLKKAAIKLITPEWDSNERTFGCVIFKGTEMFPYEATQYGE